MISLTITTTKPWLWRGYMVVGPGEPSTRDGMPTTRIRYEHDRSTLCLERDGRMHYINLTDRDEVGWRLIEARPDVVAVETRETR